MGTSSSDSPAPASISDSLEPSPTPVLVADSSSIPSPTTSATPAAVGFSTSVPRAVVVDSSLISPTNSATPPDHSIAVVDLVALVRALDPKEREDVRSFVSLLDGKENEVAKVESENLKRELVRKKKAAAERKRGRFWRRPPVGVSDEELKRQVDEEVGVPRPPFCYEEIKNLMLIERSPIHAKALQEWTRKETLLTHRVERKKNKAADLKNEIYQLIGFFSVFQGVLLTAVSQSNLLHANNWWSPILLSLVASVVTIFGVVQKLIQIKDLQITIHSEEQSLKDVIGRLTVLRREGVGKFRFSKFAVRKGPKLALRRSPYFWLVILSLVIFAVGFPLSQWRILYDPGSNPYAAPVPASH